MVKKISECVDMVNEDDHVLTLIAGFEVTDTIDALRKMQQTGVVDDYWIEETICSLVGMESTILSCYRGFM